MEVTAEAFFQLFTSQLTSYFIFQKFARQQSIFPDFSKPGLERVFLPVASPNKHLEPVTLHKTEVVWAGFLQVVSPKGLSGVPICHTGQEKNVPHTQGGAFLWSPASDWNTWKWIPPHSLWTGLWKPLHDHIAWGHLQGALHCYVFTTTSQRFVQLSGQPDWNFSVIWKLWCDAGEKSFGKYESPELALWQTLEDSCPLPHLRNISSNLLCFLALAQMFYIWEKLTGQAVRQWEIFSK